MVSWRRDSSAKKVIVDSTSTLRCNGLSSRCPITMEPILWVNHLQNKATQMKTCPTVAKQIAEKLQEPNLDLVMRIVLILGKTSAIEYFRKTREIESKGGLLIMNGSRRRTSGGVFIHLIRSDKQIPGSKLVEIFEDPNIVSINKAHLKLSKLRKRKKGGKIKKQLSNPPPSPEVPDAPEETLTELPTRADLITRDLISYEGMDFPDFP
uniref:Phosphorylated adapter RNA export protein n=2 Tax=Lygus hesperus TaxID=30085 RepID=A0A0A9W6B4_LYGHE